MSAPTAYISGAQLTVPAFAKIVTTGHSIPSRGIFSPVLALIRSLYTVNTPPFGTTNNIGWPTISNSALTNTQSSFIAGAGNFSSRVGTFMGAAPPTGSFVYVDAWINDITNAVALATTMANLADFCTRTHAITCVGGAPVKVICGTPLTVGELADGSNAFDVQINAMAAAMFALTPGAGANPDIIVNLRQWWKDRKAGGGGNVTSDGVHPSENVGINLIGAVIQGSFTNI